MWLKLTNLFEARYARTALAIITGVSLSLSAHAAEIWKLNVAKSKFSAAGNTLVLERYTEKATGPNVDADGIPAAKKFFVISNGKIYLATDAAAYDASAGNDTRLRPVGYTRWKGMNFVELGDNVRTVDLCGFRCQGGLPDNRMTLTFRAKGVDPKDMMSNSIVLNTR